MRIDNLTYRQHKLCDMLWACDTPEDLASMSLTLPDCDRKELAVLVDLMIMEAAEVELAEMTSFPAAEELFSRLTGF